MEQAWLDSLSEDWVSQPRSPDSPESLLPSLSNSTSVAATSRVFSSRKPLSHSQRQPWIAGDISNNSPLSERSLNEHNIPLSQRAARRPSKLRTDISNRTSQRRRSRTFSASTSHLTECHNTIQHKSWSLSPAKGKYETPEWKRRLLRGEVAYGEQRDLFSPGGLETIFCPPTQTTSPSKSLNNENYKSMALPSSPPPYNTRNPTLENRTGMGDFSDTANQGDPKQRVMKYKLADESMSEFSSNDLSKSSHFRPNPGATSKDQTQDLFSDAGASSDLSCLPSGAGRAVSGQSELLNEKLSPIYMSRHGTVTGRVAYLPSDLPAPQHAISDTQDESLVQIIGTSDNSSQFLPENVTAETEDFARNGRFVNLRRGGYSHEDSFQRRMLSPSSLPPIDESAMLPEESMQASTPKQMPGVKKTRPSIESDGHPLPELARSTPPPSPPRPQDKQPKTSSGSPLKLFGTYDTFTNQKLLRRLSQFEANAQAGDNSELSAAGNTSGIPLGGAFVVTRSTTKDTNSEKLSRNFKSFGEGDLDNFQFSEEVSYDSSRSNLEDEDKENAQRPALGPNTQVKFDCQLEPAKALEGSFAETEVKFTTTSCTTKIVTSIPASGDSDDTQNSIAIPSSRRVEDLGTPRKKDGGSEGKRLPKSPLKDPTPKRRRTLHETKLTEAYFRGHIGDIDSLREMHQQMQYVIGKKRKDARHDDDLKAANPNVLSMRQILRPRTPSQRGPGLERKSLAQVDPSSLEQARISQEQKIAKVQAELDSTDGSKMLKALESGQRMQDESRKGSVTTQDFLDEAKKIMAGIRGKAKSRTGLTSVEESETEDDRNKSPVETSQDDEPEDSYQDSTKEPFSRPPSREGAPVSRLPAIQHDPEILDHLRKYQEASDMDDVIASSIKSIAMAKEAANTAREIDRITDETISRASGRFLSEKNIVESEPPNIRISENPELQRKRKHSASTVPSVGEEHTHAEFPSHGSNSSSDQSTARSIPTGSSRGSDSRRVIAPHTVSHLIPEQLAGMVFDRERNIWVKRKAVVTGKSDNIEQNMLPSDETDDDPFEDIPDLSVDETQELQRIRAVAAKRREDAQHAEMSNQTDQESPSKEAAVASQSAKAGVADPTFSDPTNLSHLASSNAGRETSTRVTSWEEDQAQMAEESTKSEANEALRRTQKHEHTEIREVIVEEEVEREISINEDRVNPTARHRQRNVTISFSSPIASVIEPALYDDGDDLGDEHLRENWDPDDGNDSTGSVIITAQGFKDSISSTKIRSAMRTSSRRLSLGGHKFSARPVSRIDERDEECSNEQGEESQRSISVLVTRSVELGQVNGVLFATPRPAHEIGTLSLTPLSDFTVRQADESFGLEVSYIAGNRNQESGQLAKRTLSRSIKELVEKLTEVEPFEPFWEHMQQIDLRDKGLNSLHKLDEFCDKLEELDVSNNQICQLNGAPGSLRNLRIKHNYLSDLTAWGHLSNLQYVDLSNNEIESLSAFRSLVHLRGLRADNNKIKSLDGIGYLDGLLNLRLRGNYIEAIDFKNTKLQRLTDLDLEGNQIRDVRNLDELRSLSTLNLENNKLREFPSEEPETHWGLKYLKLSGNNLELIDVSRYPNLRLLYLDRNRLGTVTGLLKTKHLDSLSLREQQEGASLDPRFLSEAFEVRKLFLSGNLLKNFEPRVDFLNLQYLELANCGLESLAAEFGQMVSNTRVLNLNFNALRDIKPLLGIVRLKKLHVAGNRLSRLRKTTNVLAQFPSLMLADLRGNPLTLGFYPPVTETQVVVREGPDTEDTNRPEPFTLARADRIRDGKYASCLDMETKMLRRVYELLALGGCPYLKVLDGLLVDTSLAGVRDGVWEALLRADVLYGGGPAAAQGCGQNGAVDVDVAPKVEEPRVVAEERWCAEDSFA